MGAIGECLRGRTIGTTEEKEQWSFVVHMRRSGWTPNNNGKIGYETGAIHKIQKTERPSLVGGKALWPVGYIAMRRRSWMTVVEVEGAVDRWLKCRMSIDATGRFFILALTMAKLSGKVANLLHRCRRRKTSFRAGQSWMSPVMDIKASHSNKQQ